MAEFSKDVEIAILSQARESIGIYPQASVDKDGHETKRTPWQDGWNEAVITITKNELALEGWFGTIDPAIANMLAELCDEGVVFLRIIDCDRRIIRLGVNANDVFYWACAELDELPIEQIPILHALHKLDSRWGSIKWLCHQRKMRPQTPIEKDMREQGAWDDELESYPARDPKECG